VRVGDGRRHGCTLPPSSGDGLGGMCTWGCSESLRVYPGSHPYLVHRGLLVAVACGCRAWASRCLGWRTCLCTTASCTAALPVGPVADVPYLQKVAAAHQVRRGPRPFLFPVPAGAVGHPWEGALVALRRMPALPVPLVSGGFCLT